MLREASERFRERQVERLIEMCNELIGSVEFEPTGYRVDVADCDFILEMARNIFEHAKSKPQSDRMRFRDLLQAYSEADQATMIAVHCGDEDREHECTMFVLEIHDYMAELYGIEENDLEKEANRQFAKLVEAARAEMPAPERPKLTLVKNQSETP